ncbi:MAG: hypothetical protein KAS32_03545 [Candidatus Peribacteraceae bacterium]|nr:hypothetical protein [Candidatus Peribacteraceae bacterium]
MGGVAPTQVRSVDPYSEQRFSSVINRMTRIITNGEDAILLPDTSLVPSKLDFETVSLTSGICIKDDVFIQVTEPFTQLDANDAVYYVDNYLGGTGGMDSTGVYYIVIDYSYERSLPAPVAHYRFIKDLASFYDGFESKYIFLGIANIIYNTPQVRYEIDTIELEDVGNGVTRPLLDILNNMPTTLDGGAI